MPSSRKMVATLVLIVFALGLVSGQNKYNTNRDQLLGGWRDAKEDDKSTLEALQFATDEYNRGNNGEYITKVHRIIRFRKQVVAGMKYAMDVEVIVTPCSDFESVSENCSTQKKRCSFLVLSVPWMNSTRLISKSCES
ncbi:cystatin [Xenopus laevis]|uniref:Cystatin n=2 Tax=Xenopus laevis TaxID=8355 RepID=A0A1L8G1Q6_XENLA|nr:cystatin [Xenopus laevis]OCT77799.1 hypothetical protein XELAEV_18028894mg [Xenopus laevis]